MSVGKVGLLRENFLKGSHGRFKLFLIDVALRFVEQIVERIGKFLRFGLAGRFCFCRGLGLRCKRTISQERSLIPSAFRERMLRPWAEEPRQGAAKGERGVS